MHDIATIAASEWARTNTHAGADPAKFGADVALVYLACQAAGYHAGDTKATTAALAALSIPLEVLQALAQLSSACLRQQVKGSQSNQAGVV